MRASAEVFYLAINRPTPSFIVVHLYFISTSPPACDPNHALNPNRRSPSEQQRRSLLFRFCFMFQTAGSTLNQAPAVVAFKKQLKM